MKGNEQRTDVGRREAVRSRHWFLALLSLYVLVRIALDIWWVWEFRAGYPLNTDEVGYLTIALRDTQALKSAGIRGLVQEFLEQRSQAPLVPLLTVPMHLIFGEEILPSFLVQSGFLALLAFSSYGIGSRLAGPHLGLLTALVVTSIPEVIDWARSYHFAVPSAALFTSAVYALLRSEGLRSRRWTIIWGVLLGLTALSRTMTVAYLPGLIVAAGLRVLAEKEGRLRGGIHFGIGIGVGILTAATWYLRNWLEVLNYLVSYGYGTHSVYYGQGRSPFTLQFVDRGFYLPLACLVGFTLAIGLIVLVKTIRGYSHHSDIRDFLRSDLSMLVIVFVCGYVALSSSRNQGSGFALPLLPIPVALSAATLSRLASVPLRTFMLAAFVAMAGFNLAMKGGIFPEISGRRATYVPGLGYLLVLEGRGDIQRVLSYSDYFNGPGTQRISELHKEWMPFALRVSKWLIEYASAHRRRPVTVFASRDPFYNTNLLSLVSALHLKKKLHFGQLDAAINGDTVEGYRARLRDRPNFLIATDPGREVFPPPVTQAFAEEAARSLGFELVATFTLPDGRQTRIWWLDRGPSP
jgi:4-amino-4-deoxy-L-arabinose transferase-like glycosyltransferase